MNHSMNANNNIKCSVSSCTHHNSAKSVCSLSSIQVGCCGPATKSAPAPSALPTRCPSRRGRPVASLSAKNTGMVCDHPGVLNAGISQRDYSGLRASSALGASAAGAALP